MCGDSFCEILFINFFCWTESNSPMLICVYEFENTLLYPWQRKWKKNKRRLVDAGSLWRFLLLRTSVLVIMILWLVYIEGYGDWSSHFSVLGGSEELSLHLKLFTLEKLIKLTCKFSISFFLSFAYLGAACLSWLERASELVKSMREFCYGCEVVYHQISSFLRNLQWKVGSFVVKVSFYGNLSQSTSLVFLVWGIWYELMEVSWGFDVNLWKFAHSTWSCCIKALWYASFTTLHHLGKIAFNTRCMLRQAVHKGQEFIRCGCVALKHFPCHLRLVNCLLEATAFVGGYTEN